MLLTVQIRGTAPLLMHNGDMVDPFNETCRQIKKLTSKGKKKTDEDLQAIAHLEFLAGLYLDEKGEPCVPGECLEAMLNNAARKTKQGKDATAGVTCNGNFPLEYDGPRDPEKLWSTRKFYKGCGAKVGQAKVWRTRPRFIKWGLTFTIEFKEDVLNRETIEDWLGTAGRLIGLCDWRPKHGRFDVISIK